MKILRTGSDSQRQHPAGGGCSDQRRAWLASVTRTALLGVLAAGSGVLLARSRQRSCPTPDLACGQCRQRLRCSLPGARPDNPPAPTSHAD